MQCVLVVEDEPRLQKLIQATLEGLDFETTTVSSGSEALAWLAREELPAAIVLDIGLPDMSGVDLIGQIKEIDPGIPIVMCTAMGAVEMVVECMRRGAIDYVQKPIEPTRLRTSVKNAVRQGELTRRVRALTDELRSGDGFDALIGDSPAMREAVELLRRAARTDVGILLLGESGTGKEVAARAVHAESSRRQGPFVAVNCGAIPEQLIESELFGHVKGAFTGATGSRRGHFELADGGTILLDEIGELKVELQVRLLRVLQEREITRLGAEKPRSIDVRVIAASNQDLAQAVQRGAFREDLYFRLAIFPITMPPLRDRGRDVIDLADAFLDDLAVKYGGRVSGLAPDAEQALLGHRWPGNVRELQNAIERALILEDGPLVTLGSLPHDVAGGGPAAAVEAAGSTPSGADPIRPLEELERRAILRALLLTSWDAPAAAKRLGISRATIYRKIEKHGLNPEIV